MTALYVVREKQYFRVVEHGFAVDERGWRKTRRYYAIISALSVVVGNVLVQFVLFELAALAVNAQKLGVGKKGYHYYVFGAQELFHIERAHVEQVYHCVVYSAHRIARLLPYRKHVVGLRKYIVLFERKIRVGKKQKVYKPAVVFAQPLAEKLFEHLAFCGKPRFAVNGAEKFCTHHIAHKTFRLRGAVLYVRLFFRFRHFANFFERAKSLFELVEGAEIARKLEKISVIFIFGYCVFALFEIQLE